MAKPVNYDELFPGRFLKAGLFKSVLGSDKPTVTIADVDLELLPQDDGKEKARGIISLKETKMQIALNRTNGDCVKAMFGTAVRDWIGKRVTLCIERDRDPGTKGGMCDCMRVLGSPDIERDMMVTIQLPKRKPKDRKLMRTGECADSAQQKQPTPAPEKPQGDIHEALAAIETAGDVESVKSKLSAYSWKQEERQQIGAALAARKGNVRQ